MRYKSTFYFLLIISIYTINIYALMPKLPCNSICSESTDLKKPSGAVCAKSEQSLYYYRTLGKGQPTMIFSSGTGFPSDGWFDSNIASQIAKKVKVFAYDRKFTFNSCPNTNNYMPITAQDVIDNLRQLLKHENIKPPYILVGQSIGGLYMLLYAREFPEEVAGIVLMDATSDVGPTSLPIQAVDSLKRLGNPQNPLPEDQLYYEITGQLPSFIQSKNAPLLSRDIPLIVMYSTKHCLPIAWTKKLMCMTKQQEKDYKNRQVNIYNMSDTHRLIEINGDHMSFFTKDKLPTVISALDSILTMSKKH